MRPAPALAALGLCACVAGPAPDLDLDLGQSCAQVALELRPEPVLDGWKVHAAAVEDDDGARGWALAGDPGGVLWAQPWPTGPGFYIDALALPTSFLLLPGPEPLQTWLMQDRPEGARVWRLGAASTGEVREAQGLAGFPGEGVWTRRLVFVGGLPYLLAAPVAADASDVTLHLAALDAETLAPGPPATIDFWQTCTDEQMEDGTCLPLPYDYFERIEILAASEARGAGGTVVVFGLHAVKLVDPQGTDGLHHTIVSTLDLQSLGPDQPPQARRRDHISWLEPDALMIAPAHVAADLRSLYVLVGVLYPPGSPQPVTPQDVLLRARRTDTDGGAGGGEPIAFADKSRRSHLLQLGEQAAFGQIDDAFNWNVAPLSGDQVDTSEIVRLEIGGGSTVAAAGRGHFLVRPTTGPARLAGTTCNVPDE